MIMIMTILIIVLPGKVEDDDVNLFRFPVDSVNIRLEDFFKLDRRVHLEIHLNGKNSLKKNRKLTFSNVFSVP